MTPEFWSGRRVLVTGHTGFKGTWLTLWLQSMGARVTGVSDAVPTEPSLFAIRKKTFLPKSSSFERSTPGGGVVSAV